MYCPAWQDVGASTVWTAVTWSLLSEATHLAGKLGTLGPDSPWEPAGSPPSAILAAAGGRAKMHTNRREKREGGGGAGQTGSSEAFYRSWENKQREPESLVGLLFSPGHLPAHSEKSPPPVGIGSEWQLAELFSKGFSLRTVTSISGEQLSPQSKETGTCAACQLPAAGRTPSLHVRLWVPSWPSLQSAVSSRRDCFIFIFLLWQWSHRSIFFFFLFSAFL